MNLRVCLFWSVFALSACGGAEKVSPSPQNLKKIDAVTSELKDEPRVEDVGFEFDPTMSLWNVGVSETDGNELGFASYICDLLTLHGLDADKQTVHITTIKADADQNKTSKGSPLSEVICADQQEWVE